jgi:hypothetical protein
MPVKLSYPLSSVRIVSYSTSHHWPRSASAQPIDLAQAHALQDPLRPIASKGYSSQINFEAFVNFFIGSDGRCRSYTQAFRNGVIEAVKVGILDDNVLWSLEFDKWMLIPE